MSEPTPRYVTPEEERPVIPMYERPAITMKAFRRLRSIAINLAAWVEAHDQDGQFTAAIEELRSIINGQ